MALSWITILAAISLTILCLVAVIVTIASVIIDGNYGEPCDAHGVTPEVEPENPISWTEANAWILEDIHPEYVALCGRKKAEAVRAEEERNLGEAVNNFVMNAAQDAWKGNDELTTSQVSAYKELFDLFDANGDGSISIDELGHVFRIHLGKALADDDLCKIVEQVDVDQSKTIEFNEFLALMASDTWADIEKNEIIKAFSVFDRNKDGYVDAEELRLALTTYGEAMSKEEADELLAIADLDNNGLIDYSEFLTVMTSEEGVINCRQQ